MDIEYDISSSELRQRIKYALEESGLSPNSKSLIVKTDPALILTQDQIRAIFMVFGDVKEIEMNNEYAIVTFTHTVSAYVAIESLNNNNIDGMNAKFILEWKTIKTPAEINKRFEIPDLFIPLPSLDIDDTPCLIAGPLKYIAKFPINVPDNVGFHLKEKILGAKGCNFRKIVEICARGSHLPSKPKHLIALKLLHDEEYQIVLTSRFLEKFQQCENLVYELVNVIYEEFKRHCEKQGTIPPDLRVRKIEQIKGRGRAFREGTKESSIYTISNHN